MKSYDIMDGDKCLGIVNGASFLPRKKDYILFETEYYLVEKIVYVLPKLNDIFPQMFSVVLTKVYVQKIK